MLPSLPYLAHYPEQIQQQIQHLIASNQLAAWLQSRYQGVHNIVSDAELRNYVLQIKQNYMKKSQPLSKVIFDNKLHIAHQALGLHTYVSRVQGNKLKNKNELRISTLFKGTPEAFLNMIVVHELAHLKEKHHNKAFYQLCEHMLPNYQQIEFEVRVYLTALELPNIQLNFGNRQ
ncbi:YgjP-like metallopeptidase domain-containing protein [Paraglaciecola aestuariivivens]